jgi:hypothetical protein
MSSGEKMRQMVPNKKEMVATNKSTQTRHWGARLIEHRPAFASSCLIGSLGCNSEVLVLSSILVEELLVLDVEELDLERVMSLS